MSSIFGYLFIALGIAIGAVVGRITGAYVALKDDKTALTQSGALSGSFFVAGINFLGHRTALMLVADLGLWLVLYVVLLLIFKLLWPAIDEAFSADSTPSYKSPEQIQRESESILKGLGTAFGLVGGLVVAVLCQNDCSALACIFLVPVFAAVVAAPFATVVPGVMILAGTFVACSKGIFRNIDRLGDRLLKRQK